MEPEQTQDLAMLYVNTMQYLDRRFVVSELLLGLAVIGAIALTLLVLLIVADTVRGLERRRRHGRVAERLARLAWDEMSPADLLYAEREWPECFALARYIDDHKQRADARTRWLDPSLKGKERLLPKDWGFLG